MDVAGLSVMLCLPHNQLWLTFLASPSAYMPPDQEMIEVLLGNGIDKKWNKNICIYLYTLIFSWNQINWSLSFLRRCQWRQVIDKNKFSQQQNTTSFNKYCFIWPIQSVTLHGSYDPPSSLPYLFTLFCLSARSSLPSACLVNLPDTLGMPSPLAHPGYSIHMIPPTHLVCLGLLSPSGSLYLPPLIPLYLIFYIWLV